MRVAQTNLQLVMEMGEAAYSDEDVRRVGNAYKVAARAYVGKFRATGKPLISHVVGTASLLLHAGRDSVTLAAAILHAAPPDGDFGLKGWKPVVVDSVGPDIAELVEAYCALPWTYTTKQVQQLLENVDQLSQIHREALIVRLANEVEDYLDEAISHYGFVSDPTIKKSAAFRRKYILETAPTMAELATRLDVPFIAARFEELRESFAAAPKSSPWPRLNENTTAMFISPPPSYSLRATARPARIARQLRRVQEKGPRGTASAIMRRVRRKP